MSHSAAGERSAKLGPQLSRLCSPTELRSRGDRGRSKSRGLAQPFAKTGISLFAAIPSEIEKHPVIIGGSRLFPSPLRRQRCAVLLNGARYMDARIVAANTARHDRVVTAEDC